MTRIDEAVRHDLANAPLPPPVERVRVRARRRRFRHTATVVTAVVAVVSVGAIMIGSSRHTTAVNVNPTVSPTSYPPSPTTAHHVTTSVPSRSGRIPNGLVAPCPVHQAEPSFGSTYCGPDPSAGNGYGPSGECTGRETVPPCGPGMIVGRYYRYTLPGRCDGRLILNGRHWLSELPPPTPVPDMYVWVSIGHGDQGAGFISPKGAVGFDLDHGQPAPVCSK